MYKMAAALIYQASLLGQVRSNLLHTLKQLEQYATYKSIQVF